MKPLLKTPPGRSSKCSSSIARNIRELILVTLETSSSESSFFSRALRNLSPNSPMGWPRGRDGNIIGQPGPSGYSQEVKGGVTTAFKFESLHQLCKGRNSRAFALGLTPISVGRDWLQIHECASFAGRNFSWGNASVTGEGAKLGPLPQGCATPQRCIGGAGKLMRAARRKRKL
jgi:hypothetical protein